VVNLLIAMGGLLSRRGCQRLNHYPSSGNTIEQQFHLLCARRQHTMGAVGA
jgi:hypothetical protein